MVYTILYPPQIDWEFMQQRPQKMMYELARLGNKVYYCQNREIKRGTAPIEIYENLFLCYDPNLVPKSFDIVWIGNPGLHNVVGTYNEKLVVYECVDDFYEFWGKLEDEITEKADIIFTTCEILYDRKAKQKGKDRTYLIPNGFDETFLSLEENFVPDDMLQFKNKTKIGYVGALANWVDYELLRKLSQTFKSCEFILVGAEFHKMPEDIKAGEISNIHWLDMKPHNLVKYYINEVDVCLIPFVQNTITDATDPIKLYEYLALGKPVVARKLKTIEKFKSVITLASNEKEFIDGITQALSKNHVKQQNLRREYIKPFTWHNRTKDVMKILDSVMEGQSEENN